MTIAFTVLGKAQPAGSKRAFAIRKGGVPTGQVVVSDANPKAKTWQHDVRCVATEVMGQDGLLIGPLDVTMVFYAARPKGHFGSGRNSHVLKPSAPRFPIVKPDTLKLARGTEDALTGSVWRDDAQVVDLAVHKRYGVPERVDISIRCRPELGL